MNLVVEVLVDQVELWRSFLLGGNQRAGITERRRGCEVVRVKGVGFFGYFFETKDFAN